MQAVNSTAGYMNLGPVGSTYPHPHDGNGVVHVVPQSVDEVQQVVSGHPPQAGGMVSENSMLVVGQPPEYLSTDRGLQQQQHHHHTPAPVYIMNKPDVIDLNSVGTPVGSNESLSSGTVSSTSGSNPDLSSRTQPPKHSVAAATSAKSRRKQDRVSVISESLVCPWLPHPPPT